MLRNSFRLMLITCALSLMLDCSSATNDNSNSTNKAKSNSNSSTANSNSSLASTTPSPIVERENAITITADGAKYLDKAVIPDSNGMSRTKPFAPADRLRVSLSPRFDNLGGIVGFLSELSASGDPNTYQASTNVPVSSSSNANMEFKPLPPTGGYKLKVYAIPRTGQPIEIANGKVFIDPK